CFAGIAQGYLWWQQHSAVSKLTGDYSKQYKDNFDNLDMDHAVYFSSALSALDPNNRAARGRDEKVRLLRDVFTRPTFYRTPEGTKAAMNRADSAQKLYIDGTGKPDLDL